METAKDKNAIGLWKHVGGGVVYIVFVADEKVFQFEWLGSVYDYAMLLDQLRS